MKIQSLAVMFIILILPISIILETYVQTRSQTLSLQSQYDSKLISSTYDAIKAYQINSFNSGTGDLANSKMRDIEASVNTFFNSLGTNFSSIGYTKETLQAYVPAVVYTMYDGYYIYSPYHNTWDQETINTHSGDTSFHNNEDLYGLKPYVYYSCRYKKGSIDVVITYSLDNYISIQGTIGDEAVNKQGYLLSNVSNTGSASATYNGVAITPENILTENIYLDGQRQELKYIKRNGVKYYRKNDGTVFTVMNEKAIVQNGFVWPANDDSAVKYYQEAAEMKQFIIENGLIDLQVSDAVNLNGKKFGENGGESPFQNVGKIFDFDHNGGIEAEDSNFNTHRVDVIKYAVERNLSVAISNFNNYGGASTNVNFQMPELKDTDWDKITSNIGMITFLQGMNIGAKVYNGYAVITNTKNADVVSEDSIYIRTSDNIVHRPTETNLQVDANALGILNIDLERKSANSTTGLVYYYPKVGTLSYYSIVTQSNTNDNLRQALSQNSTLAKVYYTALGRERYSMYRVLRLDIEDSNVSDGDGIITPHGKGDINNDGVINDTDLNMITDYIAARDNLTGDQINRADINSDGNVNITDAMMLQDYLN